MQCSNATWAFSLVCTTCYNWLQSDFAVTFSNKLLFTAQHDRFLHSQALPTIFLSHRCTVSLWLSWSAHSAHLSAAVCLILSVTYCFYTLLCRLQTVLASEFFCKSGPLSWTLWDHLEPPGHWWFQIYDYIWRHCQRNSLSFFYSISNTFQLTL